MEMHSTQREDSCFDITGNLVFAVFLYYIELAVSLLSIFCLRPDSGTLHLNQVAAFDSGITCSILFTFQYSSTISGSFMVSR